MPVLPNLQGFALHSRGSNTVCNLPMGSLRQSSGTRQIFIFILFKKFFLFQGQNFPVLLLCMVTYLITIVINNLQIHGFLLTNFWLSVSDQKVWRGQYAGEWGGCCLWCMCPISVFRHTSCLLDSPPSFLVMSLGRQRRMVCISIWVSATHLGDRVDFFGSWH